MNVMINRFFLAGDRFLPEMHLNNQNLHIVLKVIQVTFMKTN